VLLAGSEVHAGRVRSGLEARAYRRNPVTDHLLTAQNAALVLIDFQPGQLQAVTSIDHNLLVDNVVSVARLAKTFELPIVLSTINVAGGLNPTLPELKSVLLTSLEIDRSEINAWENGEFRHAVERTGRRKLVVATLATEASLAFAALDAMRHGYEIYPVVDAVGGTSVEAHCAGLERIVRAGGQPISWVSLACELQRDWARFDTISNVVDIVLTTRLFANA
jgi:nicotinamidase-related amidase